MSKGFKRPLEVMERLAQGFVETVEDSYVRIQVAGSVRRKKANPSDIEIVVEPRFEWTAPPMQNRMFSVEGDPEPVGINLFDERCRELLRRGVLEKRQKSNGHTSWGEKAKLGILYLGGEWAPIDIFSVIEPASYGVILALRTGPGDFSKVLVNHAHTIGRKVASGRVWDMPGALAESWPELISFPSARFVRLAEEHSMPIIATPTEEAYFEALGVPCWPPEKRTAQRLRQYLSR
jgi:DNA polymerase/3'-5' exonuclease PolX